MPKVKRIRPYSADERVAGVEFSEDSLTARLMDGRSISVPLAWYPRLLHATTAQRAHWKIAGGGYGIHWPDVDEDLSTEGLLRGAPAPQRMQNSRLRGTRTKSAVRRRAR
ncbi:MAG: DUF2442 domain-containing protein [Terriglobales bacterium]